MTRIQLKQKLDTRGINPTQYSLHGDLKPDAIILYESYQKWEVFYLDEKGGRNDLIEFPSKEDACEHIYKLFKDQKNLEEKFGIKL